MRRNTERNIYSNGVVVRSLPGSCGKNGAGATAEQVIQAVVHAGYGAAVQGEIRETADSQIEAVQEMQMLIAVSFVFLVLLNVF